MKYTKVDASVMNVIETYHDEHGYMPSYREIGKLMNMTSTATVARHIDKLFTLGYIETDLDESDRARSPRGYRRGAIYGKVQRK